MPDPSHKPYQPMLIIRPNTMPRLWWLFPWSYARQLHRNCTALKALTDRLDDTVRAQARELASLRKDSEYDRVYKSVVETLKKHNL